MKIIVTPDQLRKDSLLLANKIMDDAFFPDYMISTLHGTHVGIYIHEMIKCYAKTKYIVIDMTTHDSFFKRLRKNSKVLLVDSESNAEITNIVRTIRNKCKKHTPSDIRIATVYYNTASKCSETKTLGTIKAPNYYLHEVNDMIGFPYTYEEICHMANVVPDYRKSGFVDNQVGILYTNIRVFVRSPYDYVTEGFTFTLYDKEKYPDVYVIKDALPVHIAMNARRFLNKIPFDNTIKQLNDTDNRPSNKVYKSLLVGELKHVIDDTVDNVDKIFSTKQTIFDQQHIKNTCIYNEMVSNPKTWVWEKYHTQIWRVAPTDLADFYSSPIMKLLEIVSARFNLSKDIDFTKWRKNIWVIQRVDKDFMIGEHRDSGWGRTFAFVYYLTKDTWDYKKDGGELCVYDKDDKEYVSFNPTFNSIVAWEMKNETSLLHFVNTVRADARTPRIALVGFFSK
jgi:hypoxanthine phosphoribosyltransferase